jgi:hypothetical protein
MVGVTAAPFCVTCVRSATVYDSGLSVKTFTAPRPAAERYSKVSCSPPSPVEGPRTV